MMSPITKMRTRKRKILTPRLRRSTAKKLAVILEQRAEQTPESSENRAPSLLNYGTAPKPFYIAVCKYGYGVDKVAAMAIRLAQTEVAIHAEPSALLVYRSDEYIEPIGFKAGAPVWENGDKPTLCALTNTHQGYRQRMRL